SDESNVSAPQGLDNESDENLSQDNAVDSNAEQSASETDAAQLNTDSSVQTEPDEYDYVLEFPSDSYPETAMHIYSAIENGHSDVCTIDRDGADERRK